MILDIVFWYIIGFVIGIVFILVWGHLIKRWNATQKWKSIKKEIDNGLVEVEQINKEIDNSLFNPIKYKREDFFINYKIKQDNPLYKIKQDNPLYKIKQNNPLYKIKQNNPSVLIDPFPFENNNDGGEKNEI